MYEIIIDDKIDECNSMSGIINIVCLPMSFYRRGLDSSAVCIMCS